MKKSKEIQKKPINFKEKIQKFKENYNNYKDISKLTNQWKEIMAQSNTYNQEFLTFTLSHIKVESYGFSCRIYCPYGLAFDTLEKLKPTIQDNLSCTFLYNKKSNQQFVMAKFIIEGFKNKDFIIPKTKPNELYIGNAIDGTQTIVDINKYPHAVISGSNGSGKSRLLDCLITTLICNCNERQVNLYLCQVAKNDLVIYEDVKQCYAFSDDFNKTNTMLTHVIEQMNYRSQLIKPLRKKGLGSDITDYNRINKNNQFAFIYVIFDEYASITDTSNDDNFTKKLKQEIIGKVERIFQYGRALGVFGIICCQRITSTMLSPFVKSQSNLRISGKQNNLKSSEVCMDDPYVALNLEQRVFVYKTYDYDYIKTPYIDDKIILKYIEPSIDINHRTLFSDLKKLKKNNLPSINSNQFNQSNQSNKSNNKSNDNSQSNNGSVPLPQTFNPKLNSKSNLNQTKINKSENISIETKETNKLDNSKPKSNNIPKIKPIITQDFSNVDANTILKKQETLRNNISKIPNFVPYIPSNKLKLKVIDQTNIPLLPSQKPIKNSKGDN